MGDTQNGDPHAHCLQLGPFFIISTMVNIQNRSSYRYLRTQCCHLCITLYFLCQIPTNVIYFAFIRDLLHVHGQVLVTRLVHRCKLHKNTKNKMKSKPLRTGLILYLLNASGFWQVYIFKRNEHLKKDMNKMCKQYF